MHLLTDIWQRFIEEKLEYNFIINFNNKEKHFILFLFFILLLHILMIFTVYYMTYIDTF